MDGNLNYAAVHAPVEEGIADGSVAPPVPFQHRDDIAYRVAVVDMLFRIVLEHPAWYLQ